jgi:predicted unusual protein kinase regulating ubiquinone biosynthesis (AarF/ABC1/UbiB family)
MSGTHTIRVIIKLLPSLIALRKHRREWVQKEGKNIDQEKYRKNAQRVLKTCIELGPVYIKLGQWLSSRADILPQPYMEELAKLQDDVPAVPFEQVKPTIEKDLGPIEKTFDEIDTAEISGASLGQVYRGKLHGQDIVVKVKRPGIEKMVADELHVLKKILPIGINRCIIPNSPKISKLSQKTSKNTKTSLYPKSMMTILQKMSLLWSISQASKLLMLQH